MELDARAESAAGIPRALALSRAGVISDLRMLSILHVDPERRWGGGQVHLVELCRRIQELGAKQMVACHPGGPLQRALEAEGFATVPVAIRNALDVRAVVRLRRVLRAVAPNIVHFHTAHAHAMSLWLPRAHRSFVVTRHMDYPPRNAFLYNSAVDGVIAICEAVRGSLLGVGVEPLRVKVIYLGIDATPFPASADERREQRRAWGVADDEVVVVTAAVLEARKGHRFLIDAIAALRKRTGPRARFVFCGDGSQRTALAAQVRAAGLEEHILMLGFSAQMARVLAAADLFVLPSLAEGLPMAIMEAMASRLPVVATRVSGTPEIVAHGVTGLLVPPADPRALATALVDLLGSAGRRAELGQRGRERVEQQFTSTRMAREFVAYYESLRLHPPIRRAAP
jgi:glycosyltransferase involved in cell wall biosynthesis